MKPNAKAMRSQAPLGYSVSIDEIESQLATAIDPKPKDQKRTRRAGREALRALSTDSWPQAAKWIHGWLFYLLSERPVKLSTVKRYAAEVMDDVLVAGADIDFSTFDAVDFENFYQRALDRAHRRKNIGYKADRFDDLHTFGVDTYDYPRLPEPLNKQSNSSRVRALVIRETVFATGRDRVLSSTEYDKAGRNCLWTLLTVMHRAGLRRGDALKLRLCDLDPGETFWLRISDNVYGDTKRSKFRVPLTPLLLPAERERVHGLLYDRLNSGDRDHALVFHPTGTPYQPWDECAFSRLFANLIRCDGTGEVHTPHDSRHTCFSQLQLVVENRGQWVERLTPYTAAQAEEIRSAVLHDTETGKNHYWSLAAMASHTSPQMTLCYYLHYTGLMLFESMRKMRCPLSVSQATNLGNTTARVVSRWRSSAGVADDGITIDALGNSLAAELAPYATYIDSSDMPATTPQRIPAFYQPFKRSSKDIEVAFRALTRHYTNTPIEVITRTLGISRDTLHDWIENCDLIASMRTRKQSTGTLRHISVSRVQDGTTPRLPTKPRLRLELKLLPKLIASIEQAHEASPEDLRAVCQLWLTRSTVSNSGLPLDCPASLIRILHTFRAPLPAACWRLQLQIPPGHDRKAALDAWDCSSGLKIEVSFAGSGQLAVSASLYLRHPDEENMTTMTKIAIRRQDEEARLPRKFSSGLVRYLLFMSTIVLYSPGELRCMAEIDTGAKGKH